MTAPRIPRATYRVQLTPDFGFSQARAIVPYLHRLGISDLYCSPILRARSGSQHGYDVVNPNQLNPELGTPEDFDALAGELRRLGMGLLLDIVPNHMAASAENPWWVNVLENGQQSPYAHFFDIEWDSALASGVLQNRVLLPVLGGPYGETLEKGELRLALTDDRFVLRYYDNTLPLNDRSYLPILNWRLEELRDELGGESREWRAYTSLVHLIERLRAGAAAEGAEADEEARRLRGAIRRRLRRARQIPAVQHHLERALLALNGTPGDPRSFDQLDQIISEQAYRLAFWQLARERINYRRFFDINDLVAMRVEDTDVFEQTHGFILGLARAGKVTGLRVDHIDGLRDPLGYLRRLRSSLGGNPDRPGCEGFYVVAEKILAAGEEMPGDWPVCGTTGYDFMNELGGLYLDADNDRKLDELYRRWSGPEIDFPTLAYQKKLQVLDELFASSVRSLALWLDQIAETDRHGRDIPLESLEDALVEVTASLPVYRTYIRAFRVSEHDRRWIERAVADAARRRADIGHALSFLRRLLLLDTPPYLPDEERENWLNFVLRWQQFTGPVMAKGYEDTALYIYNRLVSQNEVGGHPERPGISPDEFHRYAQDHAARWPQALNASSTHDTKRGEDVRARLVTLSEVVGEWETRLDRWTALNAGRRPVVDNQPVPDGNVELLIYQTLIGAWPLTEGEFTDFPDRIKAYLQKAAREAKTHTTWSRPNEAYEGALAQFVDLLLDRDQSREFLDDFTPFVEQVAFWGAVTSLSQLTLKITLPGVPDFFQGTGLWNLSLVDPDNRRPVDFPLRERELARFGDRPDLKPLMEAWRDGRVKLWLTHCLLGARARHSELFTGGDYLPLEVEGPLARHALAFARLADGAWAVVVVPRLAAGLSPDGSWPIGPRWAEATVRLPDGAPTSWHESLTGANLLATGGRLDLMAVLGRFPCALLIAE